MQLSKKPKTFCCFFIVFLESTLNFEHFEIKGPVSANPSGVNKKLSRSVKKSRSGQKTV